MKKTGLVIAVLGLLLAAWGFSLSRTDEEKALLQILTKVLEINHFHEQNINDEFSAEVYQQYIKTIDPGKMYLLKSDLKALNKYETSLDDEIMGGRLTFYYAVKEVMQNRISQAQNYCEEILAEPFDFTSKESFETDLDKRDYNASQKEMKDYWRKYLKYMTLNSLLSKIDKQEKALEKDDDFTVDSVKTDEELEVLARAQVKKNMKERFRRRAEIDEEDNFSFYVNAVSSTFGPHTQYFPPQQKENFDLRMTGTLEGIGAVLQQEDGYTKISSIVTGSASWKQGELKAGDVVLKVAQAEAEPVDIVDAPMKEVLKLIRGPKGTEVRLTVEKPDGDITVIPIVRDVVIREETYAKSALMKDKAKSQNFGYINLPSFYSKFGKADGRNSSDDIKAELERLKAEQVNGVILDLRNNGGGSLQDAIKMAGLFFEQGPVVQVKDKVNPPKAKYDIDVNVAYDGPLVIMINEFSASASEIVAAALKDYGRAIVIGSPSTYGKGTVQTFLDMNNFVDPQMRLEQPFGALKYTVQQFYRINGSSTQFKGVSPHIQLPDLNAGMEIGEKELDNALPWDSIPPAIYKRWEAKYDVNELRKNSEGRVAEDELFQAINERIDWLKSERENSTVSLNKTQAMEKRNDRKTRNEAFNQLNMRDENIDYFSLQQFSNEADTIVERKREEWQKQLAKDAYIREAINILADMQEGKQKIVTKELR